MATQRRPGRKGRAERAAREEARRSGQIALPPPPAPPVIPSPLLSRPGGGVAAATATAGPATFVGGSAATMLALAATGERGAAAIENAAQSVGRTLRRVAALRFAREREALTKAGYAPGPIDAAIAKERTLEGIYQRRAAERLRTALTLASKASDASAASSAVESALRREQNYSRQRALASGARVFASIGQQALEEQSPLGAYWKLGIASEHTPDCVAMAEKFWPWSVLRKIHPLLHVGCKCRLYSYGEAIAAGWMSAADVPTEAEAVKLAEPVIAWVERHHLNENEALAELLVRAQLIEIDGADLDFLAAAPLRADRKRDLEEPDDPIPDDEE